MACICCWGMSSLLGFGATPLTTFKAVEGVERFARDTPGSLPRILSGVLLFQTLSVAYHASFCDLYRDLGYSSWGIGVMHYMSATAPEPAMDISRVRERPIAMSAIRRHS